MSVKELYESLLPKIGKATLIAVSKNATNEQILEAYEAGIRDFGESRLQAALSKKKDLPDDIIWHFIGPIQSNKAAAIAAAFSYVHSIASYKVAKIISKTSLFPCKCFIEVNITNDPAKEGFSREEFLLQKEELKALEGLDIQGLMTIAPYAQKKAPIRACFNELKELGKEYPFLSMGMSSDFEIALEEGATHLRVGSLLFS